MNLRKMNLCLTKIKHILIILFYLKKSIDFKNFLKKCEEEKNPFKKKQKKAGAKLL